MKDKGFIFSLLAITFCVLVLAFFSIYVSVYKGASFKEGSSVYERTIYKFLKADQSTLPTQDTYWCSVNIFYDPDSGDTEQATISKKIYCENYGAKRIV